MERNKKIKIRNRTNGIVVYSIPDLGNCRRVFEKGERKVITFEELEKLSYQSGGMKTLKHRLVIEDLEARAEILGEVEPEYDWTEDDVKNLLTTGSLNRLLDCLDFAPKGVLDLVKHVAVEIELNDMRKREAIKNALGFDVTKAIEIKKTEYTEDTASNETRGRRVAVEETAAEEVKKPTYRRVDAK